ncbi:hypothetical protein BH23PLA1_BH23PLA1_16930 [soil metagenome]
MENAPRTAAPVLAPPTLPDHPPTFRHLDPASALAFRTPLQEHAPAADTKAGAILSALGLMFALLARYGQKLSETLAANNYERWLLTFLLVAFSLLAVAAIVQAFRTISPRFPKAPPSLAFFGDIARLPREEYIARVERMSHEEALEQMLRYNHTLATICVAKFQVLRKAIRLFRWAFATWFVLMILINTKVLF